MIFQNRNSKTLISRIILILTIILLINIISFELTTSNYSKPKEITISNKPIHLSVDKKLTPDGILICNSSTDEYYPRICSDGSGGAFVTWHNEYNDIYAQKVYFNGTVNPNATPISPYLDTQIDPQICSDGNGGAIIAWADRRNANDYNIYAQRIDSNGYFQWLDTVPPYSCGIPICELAGDQVNPQICSDGVGGAIITWEHRIPSDSQIYAQRIDSDGRKEWSDQGEVICSAIDYQLDPKICSSGIGGSIIAWRDLRGESADIYATRVTTWGFSEWGSYGIPICNAIYQQSKLQICSDGAKGAIITWEDRRSGYSDIYAQKVNVTGDPQWDINGSIICNAPNEQNDPQICSDESGGAIITWEDRRDVYNAWSSYDIYAQRIESNGKVKWNTNGLPICLKPDSQIEPQICSDENGGAIITWSDKRNEIEFDIYAQRITPYGIIKWSINGEPICRASRDQRYPQLCSNGAGGAIIVWQDYRNDTNSDIYSQLIIEGPIPFSYGWIVLIVGAISIIIAISVNEHRKHLEIIVPEKFVVEPKGDKFVLGISLKKEINDSKLIVTFESPTIGPLVNEEEYKIKISENALEKVNLKLNDLTNHVRRSIENGDKVNGINEDLSKIGSILYSDTIPPQIKKKLLSLKPQLEGLVNYKSLDELEYSTIQIKLASNLIHYPWELFFDGEDFLSLKFNLGRTIIPTKELEETGKNISQKVKLKIREKVKFLIIGYYDPKNKKSPSRKEIIQLYKLLTKSKKTEIKLIMPPDATISNVKAELAKNYCFIHYCGHAGFNVKNPNESGILLDNEMGEPSILKAFDIVKIIPSQIPILTFINACESGIEQKWAKLRFTNDAHGLASSFLLKNINYIGTLWPVHDNVANKITEVFYKKFLSGHSIGESLRKAKLSAYEEFKDKFLGWASYILYGNPNLKLKEKEGDFEN